MKSSKLQITLAAVGLSLALLVTGCGKDKANATKAYTGLKLVPLHGQTKEDQILVDTFRITFLANGQQSSIPHFSEGDPGAVRIKVDILDPEITGSTLLLNPNASPAGSTLTAADNEPGVWVLNWTPPVGFIEAAQTDREIPLAVEAHVLTTKNPRLSNAMVSASTTIIVTRTKVEPKILSINKPSTINEGQNVKFSVTVKDPSNGTKSCPALEHWAFSAPLNVEHNKINGDGFVRDDSPLVTQNADGSCNYNFIFMTEGAVVQTPKNSRDDQIQNGVDLCFSMRARGAISGVPSAEWFPCITYQFTTQRPFAVWDSDPEGLKDTEDVKQGAQINVKFKVKTATGRGAIAVTTSDKFAKWPSEKGGEPKLTPIEGDADHWQFTWTPSCAANAKTLPKSLNIVMTNSFGSKKPKANADKRKFNFVGVDDSCATKTPPAPAPAAAPVAKKKIVKKPVKKVEVPNEKP